MQITPDGEAYLLIDADGGIIPNFYAKDWRFAPLEDAASDGRDKRLRVAASAVFRIGAYGADFSKSSKADALSGHGDETTAVADSSVASEFDGALAKRSDRKSVV